MMIYPANQATIKKAEEDYICCFPCCCLSMKPLNAARGILIYNLICNILRFIIPLGYYAVPFAIALVLLTLLNGAAIYLAVERKHVIPLISMVIMLIISGIYIVVGIGGVIFMFSIMNRYAIGGFAKDLITVFIIYFLAVLAGGIFDLGLGINLSKALNAYANCPEQQTETSYDLVPPQPPQMLPTSGAIVGQQMTFLQGNYLGANNGQQSIQGKPQEQQIIYSSLPIDGKSFVQASPGGQQQIFVVRNL